MSVKKIDANAVINDHFNEKLWNIELNDHLLRHKFKQIEDTMDKGFSELSARVMELKDMVYGNNFTEIGGL